MKRKQQVANVQSFASIADAFAASMVQSQPERSKGEILTDLPGRGMTSVDFGLARIEDRAKDLGIGPEQIPGVMETAWAQFSKGTTLCESPIERTLLGALITSHWRGFSTIPPFVHDARGAENLPAGDVVIIPQMAFLRFRIDFGLIVEIEGVRRIVAIECDGQQYHQNAEKERARVDYLRSWDIPIFKFSGSEINADPMAAADRVAHAISEWRQRT